MSYRKAYHRYLVIAFGAAIIILPYTLARGVDGFILAAIPFLWGFWVTWTSEQHERDD